MIIFVSAVVAASVLGIIVGALNQASVTNAISIIKSAEQRAEAVLTQISNHKAS